MRRFINKKFLGVAFLLGLGSMVYQWIFQPMSLPEFKTNKYWGPGSGKNYVEDKEIRPLKIIYEREVIVQLRRSLERPLDLQYPLEGAAFTYGFNSNQVRPLVDYWKGIYLAKWKERQEYLNKFKHFMTQVNGLHIHFIHERPSEIPPAIGYFRIPILLLHGWPGSFREFYDLIPKLLQYTDDDLFGFDVVVPSLVGFGFSSSASKKGFSASEMAIVMRNLMLRLGYKRFIVHGGDWGAVIGSHMATMFPENVLGYHTNLCMMSTPQSLLKTAIANIYPPLFVDKKHESYFFPLKEKLNFVLQEMGYFFIQSTKPDTVGIALAANPIGLAVYILEKFSTGTNLIYREYDDGGLLDMDIDMDAMLDNIMIYYLGNKITSSMRFYAESMSSKSSMLMQRVPTNVPMGCIRFKHDLPTPVDWALRDKFRNIIHLEYSDKGGHFAALEVPNILYKDIITFTRKLCSTVNCTET